jgi:hypothetical protein
MCHDGDCASMERERRWIHGNASEHGSIATPESPGRRLRLLGADTWPSLAVAVIWLVLLFDALFGPDIVVSNAGGFTRLPSAVVVAFFAYLATLAVAKYGFGDRRTSTS